ncbi:vigilin [Nephila pilipes]|uniref:Vigilin n=1 Tax=Nephila pilipes TaxID=299642 RepID=A0A8X6NFU4_NEPPI|nr:vigilin [Nephila pilipes]
MIDNLRKQVVYETGARIVFPNENDEDKNTITIIGREEEVEVAKNELNNRMAMKDTTETTTEIDPKRHRYFVTSGAEVLKQVTNDYEGVTVSFPEIGSNSSKLVLKGTTDFFESANFEHHLTLLGTRGSKVQNIERLFNVTVKFPDRIKSEDADKVTMKGDVHADDLEDEF